MHLPAWVKQFIPPVVWTVLAPFRSAARTHAPEWEYLPAGWPATDEARTIKGWNVQQVMEAYRTKWPAFVERTSAAGPLDVSPEAINPAQSDLTFHNTIMTFAYVLAASVRQKKSLSMLDWGGGPGHYYLIAQRLLPEVSFEYHCKDVAVLAEYGQTLWPAAHYYSDESCFQRQYDLVMASCSLHYACDWQELLAKLANAAGQYLFVTRLPTVERAHSFVFMQRPYAYGYNTEYVGWCLNRNEFLGEAKKTGLELVREFVTGERPVIANAPEQCVYRGFLFRPTHGIEAG